MNVAAQTIQLSYGHGAALPASVTECGSKLGPAV
jgi:hypothetical protein